MALRWNLERADPRLMTTHSRSALARLLFGAVAQAVLRRAHVPVFIERGTEALTVFDSIHGARTSWPPSTSRCGVKTVWLVSRVSG